MNHFQCRLVRYGQRVRSALSPLFRCLRSLGRVHPLLVLGLAVLLNATFSSQLALSGTNAYAGNVQYIYDDLGRLIAAVDVTAGEAAIYQYDAVGNLLGITRQPASTVSILNFTPKSGPVGTTVTIAGMGVISA